MKICALLAVFVFMDKVYYNLIDAVIRTVTFKGVIVFYVVFTWSMISLLVSLLLLTVTAVVFSEIPKL